MRTFFGCPINDPPGGAATPSLVEAVLRAVEILKPRPSPFPLVRLGGDRDGAYLLPDDLDGIVACFSPGVSNRKEFEDELVRTHSIRAYMCDYSSDVSRFRTPLIDGMQTFEKKWLDVTASDIALTLDDWVRTTHPNPDDDLLLQIDIEGAEYRNILAASEETLRRFRMIVMELHGLDRMANAAILDQVIYPVLAKLGAHFTCVHAHPNNCRAPWTIPSTDIEVPPVLEVTLLRNDRLERTPSDERHPVTAPHPLDVVNTKNPPIFLHEYWLPAPRTAEARTRILEEKVAFYEAHWNAHLRALDEATAGLFNLADLTRRALHSGAKTAAQDPDDEGTLRDLAHGRPFRLSKGFGSAGEKGVVGPRTPYFFHTALDFNQSISIDLEGPCRLFSLVLKNRTDTCQDRARFLYYVAHDAPLPDLGEGLPVVTSPGFLTAGDVRSETPLRGIQCRYFTLFSPVKTALHLSEITLLGRRE